uniref:Pentatricopeptide repeat-containing protein n=1 Tax=Kalanchoe fedtschenkoi TaxID=63787 RepID=A0A7N0UVE3_KALFE
MALPLRRCMKGALGLCRYLGTMHTCSSSASHPPQLVTTSPFMRPVGEQDSEQLCFSGESDLEILISKVRPGNSVDELLFSLIHDQTLSCVKLSQNLVERLLHRFKDDWKSAMGFFTWAETHSDYEHPPAAYDLMVDILGKNRQMSLMNSFLEDMRNSGNLITLNTVSKAMRRLCGAGQWEEAVCLFDKLEAFGLKRNTESMNLLLDTLCKEKKAQQARDVFVMLKPYIAPSAHTFNIFIHGWCKVGRVDEAEWTIEEMKGCGCRPCVISYSTIIEFHCRQSNFRQVYALLDKMEAQGCPANVVTYTTILCSLAKSEEFDEAMKITERMKLSKCRPDTLFYNSLIYTLGRAGRVQDALHVFKVEMPNTRVLPSTSTYNSMISMLCHHGEEQLAFSFLKEIELSTVCKPDVQTYYPLLKYCFKSGKTDSLLSSLLSDMVNKHRLSLDISAYSLLIHGLCQANKCQWAYHLFEKMIGQELKPRVQTCRLLLEECKEKFMYDAAERIENVLRQM